MQTTDFLFFIKLTINCLEMASKFSEIILFKYSLSGK